MKPHAIKCAIPSVAITRLKDFIVGLSLLLDSMLPVAAYATFGTDE